jgi:CBS domain-containing protein
MIVAEVMNESVSSCSASDTLQEAAQIMWEQDCGSVPVVGDDGQLVGMITDRDICMTAYLRDQRLEECTVGEIMAQPAIACRPGDPIEKAENAMRTHRVRRLPIIDEAGHLNGILSLSDLVLAVPQTEGGRPNRQSEEILSTFAAICQHGYGPAASHPG